MEKQLSIVIISMNNFADLEICLDSIFARDHSLYEIFVIAFNFSPANLNSLTDKYADKIIVVETSGIKGFSENNNEALKLVKTEYCMVLNDDTYFTDDSIAKLLNVLKSDPAIKIVSPHILNFNGTNQFLGRPKYNVFSYFLHELKLIDYKYVGDTKQNLFKTFNICGACFMISTPHFKELGFFDERYFFIPEDIALSTLSCNKGYPPYVLKEAKVYHKSSSTSKKIQQVTIPVAKQGMFIFYKEFYGVTGEFLVRLFTALLSTLKFSYWNFFVKKSDRRTIMRAAWLNCIKYAFKTVPPKELFIQLYAKI